MTRSILEPIANPPTKNGYQVSIPSAAKPPAPVIRYLIPAFAWQRKTTKKLSLSVRRANTLRVYLERPWFQTGEGELLGVVVGTPVPGPQPDRPFVTGYGRDPMFTSHAVNVPKVSDFDLATHIATGLHLTEERRSCPWGWPGTR